MKLSFLPSETKFYDYFEKASANLLEGAKLLQKLLDDYQDVDDHVGRSPRSNIGAILSFTR